MKQLKAQPEFDEPIMDDVDDPYIGMEQVEAEDSAEGFPESHMEPLHGLLFVGCLSKNVTYAGHDFLIETLTEGEVLRVGQLMSQYRGTFSEQEARKCFTVAACVKAVDGYALVTDIEPKESNLSERIDTVKRWYPPVIDFLYRRYVELENTEFAVASSIKK